MNDTLVRILWAVLPSLFCALLMLYFNRKIAARDKRQDEKERRVEERAEVRKKESMLLLKMAFANGKLAFASAMAVKKGHANGEVDEAVKTYNEAIDEYNQFVRETHADMLEHGGMR